MGDALLPIGSGLSRGLAQGMVAGQEQRRNNMLEESLKTKQKMEKLQLEQAQQLMVLTKGLPAAWRIAAIKNPELLIYMDMLKKGTGDQQGHTLRGDTPMFGGTQMMTQAAPQAGGGMGIGQQDLMRALKKKIFDIDIEGERREEAQSSGWRTHYDQNTGEYFDVQYDKMGRPIQKVPAPTPTQKITGISGPGGHPHTIITPKDLPPGAKSMPSLGAFRESVKPEVITIETPGGGKIEARVDPHTNTILGGGPKEGGIRTKPDEIDMDVPLTVQELLRFRDPVTGAPPKYGTTRRAAKQAGYLPVTTTEETQRMAEMGSDVILAQLETTAKKIFSAEGVLDRLLSIPKANWAVYLQANTDAVLYESLKNGVLANIVRTLGEKGTLAEGDVERARALFPTYVPVPDTKEIAELKLKQLRDLMAEFQARRKPKEEELVPVQKYVPGKGLVKVE